MTKEKFVEVVTWLGEIIKDSPFETHTFIVGGAVRDFVMEEPIKDIDIVVDILNGGIGFADWMEKNGYTKGSVVTYPTYGTAMFRPVKFTDIELECVQTRGEQYHDKNSRNPETCYASIEEDAFRRDFTCNTLMYDISSHKILDLTGKGIEDIQNKIIRSPMELKKK